MKSAIFKFLFFMVTYLLAFLFLSFVFGKFGLLVAMLLSPMFFGYAYISATKIAVINLVTLALAAIGAGCVADKVGKVG